MDDKELRVVIGAVGQALSLGLLPAYHESDPPRLRGSGFIVHLKTYWRQPERLLVSIYLENDLTKFRSIRDEGIKTEITLAASKTVPQITKEIKTRLIDPFMVVVRDTQARQAKDQAQRQARALVIQDLCREYPHGRPERAPAYDKDKEPEEVENHYDLTPRVTFKVNYDGSKVEAKLDGLNRDQALLLCQWVEAQFAYTWDAQRAKRAGLESARFTEAA